MLHTGRLRPGAAPRQTDCLMLNKPEALTHEK
jgi:hypothetical protein